MARPHLELIEAIRKTAIKLKNGASYQWGHMGSCNCGNLAQELTGLTQAQIHHYAMQKYGDWTEQSMDFCPTSGLPLDLLISEMLKKGLDIEDLRHLEKLSDKRVLERLPLEDRYLQHNVRNDVVKYLNTWADLLAEELLKSIEIRTDFVLAAAL